MKTFEPTVEAALLDGVARASAAIMEIYDRAEPGTITKEDGSPLTLADQASHDILVAMLAQATPEIPVISEEDLSAADSIDRDGRYWLVDPLDGTKEFIKKNGQFTVNIGLIDKHAPLFGVVAAPAMERVWIGDVATKQAEAIDADGARAPITTRQQPADGLVLVRSSSHLSPNDQTLVADKTIVDERPMGSSLKFCAIAEGKADVYPRTGRTMEWDSAAAHAVVLAAGGRVTRADDQSQALSYGKTDDANDCGFVVWGQ